MLKHFGRLVGEDGVEYAVIPMTHYEGLLYFRDEYSAHLESEQKNLHGLSRLTPEERYGTEPAAEDTLRTKSPYSKEELEKISELLREFAQTQWFRYKTIK